MEHLELAAPWINYAKQIYELFRFDSEVEVKYDESAADGEYSVRLYVDNTDKAEALKTLLPAEIQYGNITVRTTVIPANKANQSREELFKTAFKNNEAVSRMVTVKNVMTNPITYCAFKKTVVQYPLDNLHDINGNVSTLYENIAREVFGEEGGMCFCTDDDMYRF